MCKSPPNTANCKQSNFETNTYEVSHGEKSNSQVVTFTERYIAEIFINSTPDIEGITLSWVPNSTPVITGDGAVSGPHKQEDTILSDAKEGHEFDVADDDDGAWMGVE